MAEEVRKLWLADDHKQSSLIALIIKVLRQRRQFFQENWRRYLSFYEQVSSRQNQSAGDDECQD